MANWLVITIYFLNFSASAWFGLCRIWHTSSYIVHALSVRTRSHIYSPLAKIGLFCRRTDGIPGFPWLSFGQGVRVLLHSARRKLIHLLPSTFLITVREQKLIEIILYRQETCLSQLILRLEVVSALSPLASSVHRPGFRAPLPWDIWIRIYSNADVATMFPLDSTKLILVSAILDAFVSLTMLVMILAVCSFAAEQLALWFDSYVTNLDFDDKSIMTTVFLMSEQFLNIARTGFA